MAHVCTHTSDPHIKHIWFLADLLLFSWLRAGVFVRVFTPMVYPVERCTIDSSSRVSNVLCVRAALFVLVCILSRFVDYTSTTTPTKNEKTSSARSAR